MKGLYLLQRYLPFFNAIWLVGYRQSDSFSIFLCSIFCRSNGGKFDGRWMSERNLRWWRFVKLISYNDTKQKSILFPVMMIVGFAASESRFHFLLHCFESP